MNACFCCVRFCFSIPSQEIGLGNVSETTYCIEWDVSLLYHLLPSTTIDSNVPVQFACLTVFLHNLYPSPLWSTSWSGAQHFILHTFLHPISVFFSQHMPITTCFAIVSWLCHLFLVCLSSLYLELFYFNITHPSDYSHLCLPKCHLVFFPYRPPQK